MILFCRMNDNKLFPKLIVNITNLSGWKNDDWVAALKLSLPYCDNVEPSPQREESG